MLNSSRYPKPWLAHRLKPFRDTVDDLWKARKKEILSLVPRGPGHPTNRLTRAKRDALRKQAQEQLIDYLKPVAVREFKRLVSASTNRRHRPPLNRKGRISHEGRKRMERFFDRFYRKLNSSNQIYVFWHKRKCVYVGQTKNNVLGGSGKWRRDVWRDSTHLQMFSTWNSRDLDKLECLGVDRWGPTHNRVKPPSTWHRSKCPVHKILYGVDRELKDTFALLKFKP